jgi:hypothetical protein
MIRRFLIVALFALSASSASSPVSAATIPVETGTWFIGQLAGLPPPPTVPSGGLWISGTPLGPYAFSAIRFTLPSDRGNPVLKLKVARLITAPSTPLGTGQNPIVACLTTSSWKPTGTSPGAWSAAPTYDCTKGEVSGVVANDGSTLSFELASMGKPGQTLSIALAPGTIANPILATVPVPLPTLPALPPLPFGLSIPNLTAGQLNATFDSTFQALTAASITTAAVNVYVPPVAPPSVTPVQSVFSAPAAPLDAPLPVTSPAPVTSLPPAPAVAFPPVIAAAVPAAAHRANDDAGKRVVAALLLGLFVGWAVRSFGRPGERTLTLYDVPAEGAARPASRLTRIKRA